MSTYGEQKNTKPQIEDVIPERLTGAKKQLALDLVAYLRANKLSPVWASADSWKCSEKGKGVCYVRLRTGCLSVSPYVDYTKEFEAYAEKENLCGMIWGNLAFCRRCNPRSCAARLGQSEDAFKGVKKTFLGREFDNICAGGGDAHFHDPGEAELECVKKLIDYRRRSIGGNAVPKVKYMSPKRRISKTEVITIAQDIKVVGLSLEKAGWAKRGDKIGDLWGVYADEHRRRVNVRYPITGYGFWFDRGGDYDYIVGSEVIEFSETGDEQIACTIPAGRYIKDTFNAFDFEELVTDAIMKRNVKNWAAENGLAIKQMPAFPVGGIEVYPVQDMVKPTGEVTNGGFRQDDRLKARFPAMYTLTPVE